jgi:HAD superfamily hydrolase (TIGR01490 family)
MTTVLAIFDLDDTLTLQDTESLWQQYLVQKGLLSSKTVSYHLSLFKKHYNEGTLDIQSVVHFSLSPMADLSLEEQEFYRHDFATTILPSYIPPQALNLVKNHRDAGHTTLIISAGHEFIVQPAAGFFKTDDTLCTQLVRRPCGAFSPIIQGRPLFQQQKVIALQEWAAQQGRTFSLTYFYSDSINDLPLLLQADIPIAVNPCARLRPVALEKSWPIINIKEPAKDSQQDRQTLQHDTMSAQKDR